MKNHHEQFEVWSLFCSKAHAFSIPDKTPADWLRLALGHPDWPISKGAFLGDPSHYLLRLTGLQCDGISETRRGISKKRACANCTRASGSRHQNPTEAHRWVGRVPPECSNECQTIQPTHTAPTRLRPSEMDREEAFFISTKKKPTKSSRRKCAANANK